MASEKHPDWNFEEPASPYATPFPTEKTTGRAPVDDRGRVIRQDWNTWRVDDGRSTGIIPSGGGRETPGNVESVPIGSDEQRPSFSMEELEALEDAEAIAVEVAAEETVKHRQLLKDGVFTLEELQAHYNLTDDEVAALADTPAGVKVLKELQEEMVDAETEAAPALERSDGEDLDPQLREEWDEQGGVEHHLGVAQSAVETMVEGMPADEREEFLETFDELPEAARTEITRYLAIDGIVQAKEASEAQLEALASQGEACTALIEAWGHKAGKKLAAAEKRMDLMLNAMSPDDAEAAEEWFAGLPESQKAGVIRGLAG